MPTATVANVKTSTEKDAGPLPIWLSIPLILICLAGGGYIIHWYVMTDPLSHEAKTLGDPPTQAQWQGNNNNGGGGNGRGRNNNGGPGGPGFGAPGGGPGFNPNQRRFVRDRGDGRWELRTEQARIDVSVANGKLNWHTVTYMGNYTFVPDAVKNTIYSARSLAADTGRVAALKLTQDQVRKLKNLSLTINMEISDTDKNALGAQVLAYIQSPVAGRPALEPKLLQTLDEMAQKSIPATKQQAVDRAAQINAIITPEMWKQDAANGGAPAKPPVSKTLAK